VCKADAAKPKRQLKTCLPPGRDMLVCQLRDQTSKGAKTVEMIEYVFFDWFLKNVEQHIWQLEGGVISSYKPILNPDLRQLAARYQISILGATSKGSFLPFFFLDWRMKNCIFLPEHLDWLRERERNIRRRCKMNCSAKIKRALKKLQTTPVARNCLPEEIRS
jgi:hypothetical protein